MNLQTIKQGLFLPEYNTNTAYTSYLLDAAGEKSAAIMRMPKTGTITQVGFRTGVVTTAQTLRISLQTLDANGDPSGILYGGSAAGTQAAPATDTFYVVAFGTAATATKGDKIAVVIEFDATVGNLNIAHMTPSISFTFPYTDLYTTAWTKGSAYPCIAFSYSDGTIESMMTLPTTASNGTAFNNGSIPDERALRFSLPFPCRVSGYWALLAVDNNCDVILYEGTTALTTRSLLPAERGTAAGMFVDFFDTPQLISANTEYFLSFKPTTIGNITTYGFSVSSSGIMNCFSGGTNIYFGSRTDAGAWVTDNMSRLWAGLIIDQIDSGGGLRVHPGMNGGING